MGPSYNDSFGQGDSGGTGIISSGDAGGVAPVVPSDPYGDIILSSSNSSKSEKGGKRRFLVVIVVLLFVVAIGAGVAMWLMGQPGGGSGDVTTHTKKLFNRYANYVIYGEASDEMIKDYNVDGEYYFERIIRNKDEEGFELVVKYQNDFGADVGSNDDLKELFDRQVSYLDFIEAVLLKKDVAWLDVALVYVEDGRAAANEAYVGYFGSGSDSNIYLQDYVDEYRAWLSGQLDILDIYNREQCMDGYFFDDECVFGALADEDTEKLRKLKNDVERSYEALLESKDVVIEYVENIFSMNDIVNNVEDNRNEIKNSGGWTGE